MPKNLVLAIDGTGQSVDTPPSNIMRLVRLLIDDETTQCVFYDPGLGAPGAPTGDFRERQKLLMYFALVFGQGLSTLLEAAYSWLIRVYAPGDRIYLFGFSRGAYAIRAVAGLVGMLGLLGARHDNLVTYAARVYGRRRDRDYVGPFRDTFARHRPEVHFLGLFDTVKSVFHVEFVPPQFTSVELPLTFDNPAVRTIRHAVAIDERRRLFRTNLCAPAAPGSGRDVRQVWFAGEHSDIGGGYPLPDGDASLVPLAWLVREAVAHGLLVDPARLPAAGDGSAAPLHDSMTGIWWLAEVFPKRERRPPPAGGYRWLIPLGEPRWMAEGSLVHASVVARMAASGYRPRNLPKRYEVVE